MGRGAGRDAGLGSEIVEHALLLSRAAVHVHTYR